MTVTMETTEQLAQLNERLLQNAQSLHISRVPTRIKREFVEWANAEFCGDYGLALKHLWEGKLDAVAIMEEVSQLNARIAKLEMAPQQEEKPKVRRMVSGREIPLRS